MSECVGLNLLQGLRHQHHPTLLPESWHVGYKLYVVNVVLNTPSRC